MINVNTEYCTNQNSVITVNGETFLSKKPVSFREQWDEDAIFSSNSIIAWDDQTPFQQANFGVPVKIKIVQPTDYVRAVAQWFSPSRYHIFVYYIPPMSYISENNPPGHVQFTYTYDNGYSATIITAGQISNGGTTSTFGWLDNPRNGSIEGGSYTIPPPFNYLQFLDANTGQVLGTRKIWKEGSVNLLSGSALSGNKKLIIKIDDKTFALPTNVTKEDISISCFNPLSKCPYGTDMECNCGDHTCCYKKLADNKGYTLIASVPK
jgi:hypothetical protein